jgi:hypothetical protein
MNVYVFGNEYVAEDRWSLSNSVRRIVLSSQQVNENQPTMSRLC